MAISLLTDPIAIDILVASRNQPVMTDRLAVINADNQVTPLVVNYGVSNTIGFGVLCWK